MVLESFSVPKTRNRRTSAVFSNRSVKIASFAAGGAENRKAISEELQRLLGHGIRELQHFCVFNVGAFFGR